jgi:predicted ATPase
MITRAKFENFKALRDVEITFDSRLTVLVGPNGSGKTSVLQGIQFLGKYALHNNGPRQFVIPFETVLVKGSRRVYGWEEPYPSTIVDEQIFSGSRLEIVSQHLNETEVFCQYSSRSTAEQVTQHRFSITQDGAGISGDLPSLHQIRSTTLLQFDPVQLRSPSLPQRIPPLTNSNGAGLATSLGYTQKKYPDQFQAIIDSLKLVIPNFLRIRLDIEHIPPNLFADVLIFDFKDASDVRPASVSDGTLIVLGLLSVIFGPEQPELILLDDLDHRLHPKAQMRLVDLLHKLLDQFPDLQIIATAHSPYILDELKPNEVRVMGINEDGSAVCARLEDHPKFPMWKNSMSPGEFWSHAGEDWVKKLTPQTVAP